MKMYCGGTTWEKKWTSSWVNDNSNSASTATRNWHHTPAVPLQAISGNTSCILAPGDISEYNNGKDDDEKLVQLFTGLFYAEPK